MSPPFVLNDSCYASFEIKIELYFKNGERKIVCYYLDIKERGSLSGSQEESHIFQNVSPRFREQLLKCGGKQINEAKGPRLRSESRSFAKKGQQPLKAGTSGIANDQEFEVETILNKKEKNGNVSKYIPLICYIIDINIEF